MCNQKGGVGKTTTTLLSASSLARRGFNVLVLDMDQQANTSTALLAVGMDDLPTPGVFGITCDPRWPEGGKKLEEVIAPAADQWGAVDLIPGSPHMALVDTDIHQSQPNRLRAAFRQSPEVLANYDLVLVDCPPSVGRVMFATLVACTHYVIVTEPTPMSVEGMGNIERSVIEVRQATERDTPELLAALINRMRRTTERDTCLAEVRDAYGETALEGEIYERAAVEVAYSRSVPIHAVPGKGSGDIVWQTDRAWDQMLDRLGLPRRLEAAS